MSIETWVSGFLFLFILVLYLFLLPALGYKLEIEDLDVEMQQINTVPKRFQASIGLALFHNTCVITLAILLFIAFGSYNLILGMILTIFRIGEGLILSYNDIKYWELLNIAKKYSGSSDAEKISLINVARTITETKSSRFAFAMIFWSIGSLAFSIILVTYSVVPIFGWMGIVASILVGFGDGILFVKKKKVLFESIGGLVALLFEIIIGVWLMFFV